MSVTTARTVRTTAKQCSFLAVLAADRPPPTRATPRPVATALPDVLLVECEVLVVSESEAADGRREFALSRPAADRPLCVVSAGPGGVRCDCAGFAGGSCPHVEKLGNDGRLPGWKGAHP